MAKREGQHVLRQSSLQVKQNARYAVSQPVMHPPVSREPPSKKQFCRNMRTISSMTFFVSS